MRIISLIFSLLMIPFFVNAQATGNDAVVAAVYMNVLYRGMANPIEIAVPGVTSDKVTAIMTNGTLSKSGSGFSVSPGEQDESMITVLVDNKKVSEKTFRIKNVPDPVAVFAGKYEGQIDKEIALKTDMLNVELKDFLWDLKFEITGFTFFCSHDNMDFEETSHGNKMTDKMKSLISDTNPGKIIAFKDIKSIGPDGKSRDLNQIVLTIK
jgi:gliding motility-associated protein GldM